MDPEFHNIKMLMKNKSSQIQQNTDYLPLKPSPLAKKHFSKKNSSTPKPKSKKILNKSHNKNDIKNDNKKLCILDQSSDQTFGPPPGSPPDPTSEWVLVNSIQLHPECDAFSQIGFVKNTIPNMKICQTKDNCILIDYHYFVQDLYSSFKNQPDQIKKQFFLDIGRENFCINGVRYTDPLEVEKFVESLLISSNKKDLFYMLATQCSMYLPCLLLYKTYCEERSDILVSKIIGETRNNKALNIDIQCDLESSPGKLIYIFVKKQLRIFHLQDSHDVTDMILDTQIYLDFSHEKYIVLSWKKTE